MAKVGKYCKAYLLRQFRSYPGWTEMDRNARATGRSHEPRELDDEAILYLQENYVVTDGIFIDEHIIFENVTDDWKQYCHEVLSFQIPIYEPIWNPRTEE